MTKVEHSIEVDVPIATAYDQWTQFEEFPHFMSGVEQVEQIDDRTLRWVAQIAGVRRQWTATILEQIPDRKVAWAATQGATNAGAVYFADAGAGRTRVTLHLDYEPEGVVEKAGDAVGFVSRQATADLERFKAFIEAKGAPTGAWHGEVSGEPAVGIPDADDAAASRGDSGKAEEIIDITAPDVVDVLTDDHREAVALLTQLWITTDASARRDLTDTLIAELVRHSVAEEMYVYPAMRAHLTDGDQAVEHDIDEHKQLERVMKDLEGVDPQEPAFTQLLRELEMVLTDHIADEESVQFPELRARIPRADLVRLADKVESAKKLAPTRPHPSAPNAQLFHKLVGPGVGMVDRLRDRLSGRHTSA